MPRPPLLAAFLAAMLLGGPFLGGAAAQVQTGADAEAGTGAGTGTNGSLALIPLVTVVVHASPAADPAQDVREAPQTLRLYDQAAIDTAKPKNVADLLAQNASGFSMNFSPGQTMFNLRGGTDGIGQGWDDTGEVIVLVNGRPAGTENLGKLSTYDVERVEVLRGPASVRYGNAAIGGVINLVTKDGETAPGTHVQALFGSYDRYTGTVETGGKEKAFDWYFESTGGLNGDYDSGSGSVGRMPNTAYNQANLDLRLGYDLDALNRLDFTVRHDGVYDAGHPGVTLSLTDHDNRYNTSIEAVYSGRGPDGTLSWASHAYYVQDVDEFDWSQNPLIGSLAHAAGYAGQPGITQDDDVRRNNVAGDKLSSTWKAFDSNSLLSGVDLQYTWVDNTRSRLAAPGYPTFFVTHGLLSAVNLPPTEYNSETYGTGVYLEDTQKFLGDRLSLCAGGRVDYNNEKLLTTPFETASFDSRAKEAVTPTWRLSATYDAASWLTLRTSIGTSFLMANPTEIYADTQQGNGVTVSGNRNLKSEDSLGWETGAHAEQGPFSADLAYFENSIHNHISVIPTANPLVYTWGNFNEKFRGLDFQAAYDIARAAGWAGYRLEPYGAGTAYFTYQNQNTGLVSNNTHTPLVDAYNAAIGLRGGKIGKWNIDLFAVWTGPSYELNTTQSVPTPPGQPFYATEIGAFWTLNTRETYQINKTWSLFFGINNLFNLDYDPYYLSQNDSPSLLPAYDSAGGVGSSQPGREFFGGFSVSF